MVHSIQLPFLPPPPMTAISVDTILKNHNSGNFTVSACIKWLGEPVKLEHATKMVREAELTDPSGTINLWVWDSHIQHIADKQFYTVTNCKLKQYFGKHLPTRVNTAVTKAKAQDISNGEQSQNKQNWLCCPEIMNVYPTVYPVCNKKECPKKISQIPGSNIVRCLHSNRTMPLKNSYIGSNINFHLQKEDQHFSVTPFPKIVGNILQEDISQCKDNIDDLAEKFLLLENVDFQLSPHKKLIIRMKTHTTSKKKWPAIVLVKLEILRKYLLDQLSVSRSLQEVTDICVWKELAEMTLTLLIIFNKRQQSLKFPHLRTDQTGMQQPLSWSAKFYNDVYKLFYNATYNIQMLRLTQIPMLCFFLIIKKKQILS